MLREKELYSEDTQWLLPARFLVYVQMIRSMGKSVNWRRIYDIPHTTTPTFLMEGYDGPSTPIPPTLLQSPPASLPVPANSSLPSSLLPMPTPRNGPPVPQQPRATPEAGPSNKSAATEKPTGKKRKGDILVAGPKKTRIVSKEFIDSEDEETSPKPKSKSKSRTPVESTAKPKSLQAPKPKSKSQPPVESKSQPLVESTAKPKSLQVLDIPPKPKSKSQARGSPLPRQTPTTQERLEAQTKAIKSGEFKLADVPCDSCTKRVDREVVPCAVVATGEKGACFTCRFGKTSCSLAAKKRKKAELEKGEEKEEGEVQVKIVRKQVKKPKVEKQDVEMTVSEGAEDGGAEKIRKQVKIPKTTQDIEMVSEGAEDALAEDDVEITEVGQEQEQVKQEDSEMIDLTNVESDVGTPPRLDKGKGRVTPAITLQPPTPTPPVQPKFSLTMDAQEKTSADLGPDFGSDANNGKNQCFCSSPH